MASFQRFDDTSWQDPRPAEMQIAAVKVKVRLRLKAPIGGGVEQQGLQEKRKAGSRRGLPAFVLGLVRGELQIRFEDGEKAPLFLEVIHQDDGHDAQ